jgi:hypothetical protein
MNFLQLRTGIFHPMSCQQRMAERGVGAIRDFPTTFAESIDNEWNYVISEKPSSNLDRDARSSSVAAARIVRPAFLVGGVARGQLQHLFLTCTETFGSALRLRYYIGFFSAPPFYAATITRSPSRRKYGGPTRR